MDPDPHHLEADPQNWFTIWNLIKSRVEVGGEGMAKLRVGYIGGRGVVIQKRQEASKDTGFCVNLG